MSKSVTEASVTKLECAGNYKKPFSLSLVAATMPESAANLKVIIIFNINNYTVHLPHHFFHFNIVLVEKIYKLFRLSKNNFQVLF